MPEVLLQDLSDGFMRSTFQMGFMSVPCQVETTFKVDPTIPYLTLAEPVVVLHIGVLEC
jgi:hypothetical protein